MRICPSGDLTAAQANALFDELRIYLDDGSGTFESGVDSLVATIGTFTGGTETISLTDGDANVQVPFGSTKRFFVVRPDGCRCVFANARSL